jgi:hypothetical protein
MGISGKHLPAWILKNAKYVVNDEISTQDFVKAVNYLKNKGLIV